MAAVLMVIGDIGSAMRAGFGQPALGFVRLLGKGPGGPRPRRTRFAPTLALGISFPVPAPGTILRRRRVRVRRCLLRLAEHRLQFRDAGSKTLNQGGLLIKQSVFLGVGQAVTRRAIHT